MKTGHCESEIAPGAADDVMNELNVSLQRSILTLAAHGWSHRWIARKLAETVGRYLRLADGGITLD